MAGEDYAPYSDAADADDTCPLCGSGPAARVTLAKRRLFAQDATVTVTARADDSASSLARLQQRRDAVAGLLEDELEAERAAAADAASEAMAMILRLQRDKSEAMIEARQYRRFAEERFAHVAAEADALRDALARRDATVRVLSARLRDCQARLLRLGYPTSPTSPVPSAEGGLAIHAFPTGDDDCIDCPSVPCLLDHPAPADVGTPRTHHLLNKMSGHESDDTSLVCGSPRHVRPLSIDTFSYDDCNLDEYHPYDRYAPDQEEDEMDDRVYTVDAVHGVAATPWAEEEEDAAEIQKLKVRLQALEADRESMRHAIMSMGDEKAQLVLLREIAQQLCKEGAVFPAVQMKVQPVVVAQRNVVVKQQPCFIKVFVVTVIKWIASLFCWKRKSNRVRYPIGLCGSNVGLMLILDRYPKQRCRRFIKRI